MILKKVYKINKKLKYMLEYYETFTHFNKVFIYKQELNKVLNKSSLENNKKKYFLYRHFKEAIQRHDRQIIKKPVDNKCQKCNLESKLYIHHQEYSVKQKVLFLCNDCHRKEHRNNTNHL